MKIQKNLGRLNKPHSVFYYKSGHNYLSGGFGFCSVSSFFSFFSSGFLFDDGIYLINNYLQCIIISTACSNSA